MGRTDQVSPTLRTAVMVRDFDACRARLPLWSGNPICVAPLLDPDCGPCSGRSTIAHVKREPRMGQRASVTIDGVRRADASVLASVCQGHAEDGTKAGRCWVTRKSSIIAMRAYLRGQSA